MKVLMLVFNQVSQGTYWRAFNFARELVKRGHQVTLLATSRKSHLCFRVQLEEGVELVETPDLMPGMFRSGWDPWNIINRIIWLKGRKYDIVHAFESRPTVIFPALVVHKQGVPLVMDWADWFGKGGSIEERPNRLVRDLLRPIETYFEEHYRNKADGTTVICSLLNEKALAQGIPNESILLLRNGADTDNREQISKDEARRQINLLGSAPVIGYVGTIFLRDADLLIKAFDCLLRQQPDARLIIAGYCPVDIRSKVSCADQVIQTGFVDNHHLNIYLSACDIFWLPLCNSNANRGRFPYKLTDYMSIGRPIVATLVGDIPQIFAENVIGSLASDDPELLAQQTISLLSNPSMMVEMGLKARKLAETIFSWANLTTELEKFYQRVVGSA